MKKGLFFICLITFITGCQKEGTKVYIQDSFKKWTLFNPGSYWIYYNEQTMKLDSVYVDTIPLEYFYPPDKDKIHYEIIIYNAVNLAEFTLGARADDSFLLCEGSAGHDFIFSYRVSANISQNITEACGVVHRYDTLTINNIKFFNVIHIRDSSTNNFLYSRQDYFFAKNIGIIKYSKTSSSLDTTWSLLRYHVVQ